MADKLYLKIYLYMVGADENVRMVSELRRILEEKYAGHYLLEVIDILNEPEIAEEQNIFATPTLVKTEPPPPKRIIGDFSSGEKVLKALGLT